MAQEICIYICSLIMSLAEIDAIITFYIVFYQIAYRMLFDVITTVLKTNVDRSAMVHPKIRSADTIGLPFLSRYLNAHPIISTTTRTNLIYRHYDIGFTFLI